MKPWNRLLQRLGLLPVREPRLFAFEGDLQTSLASLASSEGRSEQEVAADLLTVGLTFYQTNGESWRRWQNLTPREQDVAALACLGCANKQIALRLGLSTETIKTHMHNLLGKFQCRTRSELAHLLSEWDLSAWWDKSIPARRT